MMKTRTLISVAGYISLLWTFSLVVTPHAAIAQQWTGVYGHNSTGQWGADGVTPVEGTCEGGNGGYIAVGSSDDPNGQLGVDVYVVRTNNNGVTLWEYTYDLRSLGGDDYGNSIIELSDGSGFVVVGTTDHPSGTGTSAFLLKINCSGTVVWTQLYSGDNSVTGLDVVEMTTGAGVTSAGDFVVVGASDNGSNIDALIFRTDGFGGLLWDSRYATNSKRENEELVSVIEATPNTYISSLGDIVAVGTLISSTDSSAADYNALVIRVSGADGSISTTPGSQHGISEYGFGDTTVHTADIFHSLIELQNPSDTGTFGLPNIVLVGHGTNVASYGPPPTILGGPSIYLVKLDNGNPCVPTIQAYVGIDNYHDEGHDIKEVTYQTNANDSLQQWDLVVTGWTNAASSNASRDALLLPVSAATLVPTSTGTVHRTDFDVDGNQWGVSLDIVDGTHNKTRGVILCGITDSLCTQVSPSVLVCDPEDLYMVKTDLNLSAGDCEDDYSPVQRERSSNFCLYANTGSALNDSSVINLRYFRDWDDLICTGGSTGGKAVPLPEMSESLGYRVSAVPNPIRRGEGVSLRVNGVDLPDVLDVTVTNSLGETIYAAGSVSVSGDGTLTLESGSWTPGVYFITVSDNGYRRALRVVITD